MRGAGLLIATGLVACGDPLVGETYLGTPIFELAGPVKTEVARVPAGHGPVRARLFWVGAGSVPLEQEAELSSQLLGFSMHLFEAPPASALHGELGIGLAIIALFADVDGDGVFDGAQDLLLGASRQHLVVHAPRPVRAGDPAADLVGLLPAGYHLFEHDAPSQCRFEVVAECEPEGRLVPAPGSEVVLNLWGEAHLVRVPAPLLSPGRSIWALD